LNPPKIQATHQKYEVFARTHQKYIGPNRFHDLCSPPAFPRPPRASLTLLCMSTTLSFFQALGMRALQPGALAFVP
jgi:hypothetical protein